MKTVGLVCATLIVTSCQPRMTEQNSTFTNRLKDTTSPYLQQHAHNPVEWYPWGDEALDRAKRENKPILLSIGYSSCHWCHVMAHESFENKEIAAIMNRYFINIKLDREERPDIDQIYMDAIQAMGLRGGWPLNVFLTPDQKPFYGGTYFPPKQWRKLLTGVNEAYTNNYDKLYTSASQFAASLQQSEVQKYGLDQSHVELKQTDFESAFQQLSARFDREWGGMKKAPKFPMPCVWQFIGRYGSFSADTDANSHFLLTLDKMAQGGIYDQIGGGFSRYSVDGEWHVPHFEKMLYDNGQLLSLYATGYTLSKKEAYLEIMRGIAQWLRREMRHDSGGFYSALDADSEGEEGKFYVWNYDEIKTIAGKDLSIIAEYYDVSKSGNWEGVNVLRKTASNQQLSEDLGISENDLKGVVSGFNERALTERNKRPAPGLDNKIISGWNGLALAGLSDAFKASGDSLFLDLASQNAVFILNALVKDGKLYRRHNSPTEGFLEDYAAVIKGFLAFYETSFEERYLTAANDLIQRTLSHFFDQDEHFFFFTGEQAEALIARKKELFDNVIPSSNSLMAGNLLRAGTMLDNDVYKAIASKMILKVNALLKQEPEYLSNWGFISLDLLNPVAEVLIVGDQAFEFAREINSRYLPGKVIMATRISSDLPLFRYKEPIDQKTTVFVCYNKTCKRPVFTVKEALNELEKQ